MASWTKVGEDWAVRIEGGEGDFPEYMVGRTWTVTNRKGKKTRVVLGEHVRSWRAKGTGHHVDLYLVERTLRPGEAVPSAEAPALNEQLQEMWAERVERDYGVRIIPQQFYVEARTGYVYAGSEYVARVGQSVDPADASDWAETIAHMPRFGRGVEIAERVID